VVATGSDTDALKLGVALHVSKASAESTYRARRRGHLHDRGTEHRPVGRPECVPLGFPARGRHTQRRRQLPGQLDARCAGW
jgi:hypothetical protein